MIIISKRRNGIQYQMMTIGQPILHGQKEYGVYRKPRSWTKRWTCTDKLLDPVKENTLKL